MKKLLVFLSLATLSFLAQACKKEVEPDYTTDLTGNYKVTAISSSVGGSLIPSNTLSAGMEVHAISKTELNIIVNFVPSKGSDSWDFGKATLSKTNDSRYNMKLQDAQFGLIDPHFVQIYYLDSSGRTLAINATR